MDWKQARKRLRCDCSVHDVASKVVEYFIITPIFSQFGSIKINFDDRLLRSDEKRDLLNLKEEKRTRVSLKEVLKTTNKMISTKKPR